MKEYKEVNGTSYSKNTSDKVIDALERARVNRTRITLDYGDVVTGKSWGESYDITGYVGRSYGGTISIPILVFNTRSSGGGSILDDCIIKITESKYKGRVLYKL